MKLQSAFGLARQTALTAALVAGCGVREMPKGTGASGKVTTVAAKVDDRLDLINKLSDVQQRAFDRFHEPFDKVFGPTLKSPPKGFKSVEDFRKAWDALKFCAVKENEKYVYFVTIKTNLGSFDVRIDDASPNHARAFLVLGAAGYFSGAPVQKVGASLTIGDASTKPDVVLKPETVELGIRAGGVVILADKDGKSPFRPSVLLETKDDLVGKASVLGTLANQHVAENAKTFEAISKAARGKAVVVQEVRVKRMDEGKNPLFTAEGIALPNVDEQGKIKILTPAEREEAKQKFGMRKKGQ